MLIYKLLRTAIHVNANTESKVLGVSLESQMYLQSDLDLGVIAGENQLSDERAFDTRKSKKNSSLL